MSHRHRLDKTLFAAGIQCAKRLYLEFHRPSDVPSPLPSRQALVEIGLQLTELAVQGFPRTERVDAASHAEAVEQTRALIEAGTGAAIIGAAFERDGVEVHCDIVLVNRDQSLDIFEVKSGTKIKPRHVMDVALQMWCIEGGGLTVRSASLLHLDAEYRHDGSKTYPVHKLFKNVDVTKKARKRKRRVPEFIENFNNVLEDETSLDLPTGTWCTQPISCGFLTLCRGHGPDHPLLDLPDLSPAQETTLHQQGIESITQVDPEHAALNLTQRRVLRAVQDDKLVVEKVVVEEFDTVIHPLCFIAPHMSLQVLPVFEQTRPWQHLPFLWSAHILHEDGRVETKSFLADGTKDPRSDFVVTMADCIDEVGTVFTFAPRLEVTLRQIMEDLPALKDDVKCLLQMDPIELDVLVRDGMYHPGMRGSYALENIFAAVTGQAVDPAAAGRGVHDEESSRVAFDKLMNSRTRATTRTKLRQELLAYAERRSSMMMQLFQALAGSGGDAKSATANPAPLDGDD